MLPVRRDAAYGLAAVRFAGSLLRDCYQEIDNHTTKAVMLVWIYLFVGLFFFVFFYFFLPVSGEEKKKMHFHADW